MTEKEYKQYEPMLIKISNKFKNNIYGVDMDDIMQIGTLGMIRAFDTYQDDKGTSFNTYIYNCIEWSIGKEFHNLKRIHSQYKFTSLDHEIDEDTNMYDIIPNSSVSVESEVIEDMTLQEYIEEFKRVLSPTKANIFIDIYVNGVQLEDIAAKYDKKYATINSMIRHSRIELASKSYRIRKEFDRYIKQRKESKNLYADPAKTVAFDEYYNSRLEEIKSLEEEQIKRDMEFMSYYKEYISR